MSLELLVVNFGLTEDEAEEFGKWAFGKFYRTLNDGSKFMDAWNYYHESKLKLLPNGFIYEDLEKMIALWRENKLIAQKESEC